MKRKPKVPKARNPAGADAHGKYNKSERIALKKELKAALGYSRIGLSNKY